MKRLLSSVLTFGLILSFSAQHIEAQRAESQPEVSQQAAPVPKQVLAFYYPWYGNPETSGRWVHWSDVDEVNQTIGNATHYPTLGAYDSHDPDLVAQHVSRACEIGLAGFIVSWWGPSSFEDQAVPLLLDTALQCGLQITVYFETVRGSTPTPDSALTDVLYLLQQYANHPAWLRVADKPVIFVYSRAVGQIGLDGWQQVIDQTNQQYPGGALFIGDRISAAAAQVFDGIHTYNPTGQTAHKTPDEIRLWAQTTFPQWIATAGDRISCVTIIPGYDDSKLGRPDPRPITDRWDGDTYRVLWEEAIAADPNWILITSWNEWHEGSEIEPSIENQERELETTAEFAPGFQSIYAGSTRRRPSFR
jgi:glycoprotein endo-alpha-1,2-mannosidase